MKLEKLKSLFLKILIGCLIAAAGLAVVTVLVGHFNDMLDRALFTILLVAAHSLVSFSFILNNEKEETFDSLTFFSNVTFILIVVSFITATLGVWQVLGGDLVARLYELYFVLLFATLHGEVLAKTLGKQSSIDKVVFVNYGFMTVVILMLIPIIFVNDLSSLSSFYYRLLAAAGIVDATLTLIAVILHKLYIQKHPAVVDPVFSVQPGAPHQPANQTGPSAVYRFGMNIFVLILLFYVGFQILAAVALLFLGRISR